MATLVTQVESGITRVQLSSWQGRAAGYQVSVYLLDGVLVDTGFPRAGRELLDVVRRLQPRGAIVTHWHEDHAGNAPALAATALPLAMHPECEVTLRACPAIRAYRSIVWGQSAPLTVPLVPFDPAPLRIIRTPGHSDDHIIVWDAERRIVASGDLFLGVKVRVAHEHESPAELVRSLRTIVALEPRLLLDAHRGAVTNPVELLQAKIAWLEDTMGLIVSLDARGVHVAEIQRKVLGAEAFIGIASRGEYSKRALVHAVLREAGAARV